MLQTQTYPDSETTMEVTNGKKSLTLKRDRAYGFWYPYNGQEKIDEPGCWTDPTMAQREALDYLNNTGRFSKNVKKTSGTSTE